MTSAADIKAALHRRYNGIQNGREGEQWVCIEEARSGAGFAGNNGQCDFLAINTWESRGMQLIGHEIKVSLADWKKELANPDKAEVFSRFCRLWYVAMPSDLCAKVKHEIPPNWGLFSLSEKGKLTEVIKPTVRRDVQPVPPMWWVGWLAQVDRLHKRRLPQLVAEQLAPERERMKTFMEDHANRRAAAQDEATLNRLEMLDKFEAATGMHLRYMHRWDLDRLGTLIRVMRNVDLTGVANHLRASVTKLEETLTLADALPEEEPDGEVA